MTLQGRTCSRSKTAYLSQAIISWRGVMAAMRVRGGSLLRI